MRMKPSLSYDDARTIATGCLDAAAQHGVAVCIVVVDDAGALICAHRMDGARQYTIDLASQKARTAASIGVPTRALEALNRTRQAAWPRRACRTGRQPCHARWGVS